MAKIVAILFGLLALSSTALAVTSVPVESTASATTSAFSGGAPVKVFDYSNTTDTKWTTIMPGTVTFGPGANSSVLNVWGVSADSTSAPTKLSTVVKRVLNATAVGDGTDGEATTGISNQVADTSISVSASIASQPSTFGVYNDFLWIAGVGGDGAASPGPFDQVYVTVINGTTAATALAVATATTTAATTSWQKYNYMILNSYVVDGVFYLLYAAAQTCTTGTTSGACSGSTTKFWTDIYIQGVFGNGSKVWTTPASIYTVAYASATAGNNGAAPAGGTAITSDLMSSATKLYVAYRLVAAATTETVANTGSVMINSVTISSGAAAGASTLVTDVLPTASVANGYLYTVIGGFTSTSTYGIGLGVQWLKWDTTTTAISTTITYGASVCLNASTTATSVANFSSASSSGVVYMKGVAFGNSSFAGFALAIGYMTSTTASPLTLTWSEYYQNGTAVTTTPTSFISLMSEAQNLFLDQSNNWWFGYTTANTETTGYTPLVTMKGYIGKLIATVYASGNFLTSTIAFLIFVVASLFAF